MHDIHVPEHIEARYLPKKGALLLPLGLIAVGAISFFALLASDPNRAWQSYVSNWLFFTSVAMGAVIFAVATTIVKARWNWSVRRLSVAFAAFLLVSARPADAAQAKFLNCVQYVKQATSSFINGNPGLDVVYGCCDFTLTGAAPAMSLLAASLLVLVHHGLWDPAARWNGDWQRRPSRHSCRYCSS